MCAVAGAAQALGRQGAFGGREGSVVVLHDDAVSPTTAVNVPAAAPARAATRSNATVIVRPAMATKAPDQYYGGGATAASASSLDHCRRGHGSHFAREGPTLWDVAWVQCNGCGAGANSEGCKATRISYPPRDALLDEMQGKWLFFVGDSATRGLVLSLLRHLDPLGSTWVNVTRDFNVTQDEYAALVAKKGTRQMLSWEGTGGDMLRGDYIFKKHNVVAVHNRTWAVAYKKQSQLCAHAMCPYYRASSAHLPAVFQDGNALWEDWVQRPKPKQPAVRVSFHNAIGTTDIARILDATSGHPDAVAGQPDVIYANVGAWSGHSKLYSCDAKALDHTILRRPAAQFIWGTDPRKRSGCDNIILSHFPKMRSCASIDPRTASSKGRRGVPWCFLDRAETFNGLRKIGSSSDFAASVHMDRPHMTYGASTHDYMRLLSTLVPAAPSSRIGAVATEAAVVGAARHPTSRWRLAFDETCWMTMSKVQHKFGKGGLPPPPQGWKTPWKLACDFKWVETRE